jgi:glutamate-1-semialdehyde 2,1-aminomutase
MSDWTFNAQDRELFDRELNSFIPPVIFDAHAHWYRVADFAQGTAPALVQSGPAVAGSAAFDASMAELIPDRKIEGLFFPFPHPQLDSTAANRFLCDELRMRPESRGQIVVTPSDDPEQIRELVRRQRIVGLKCYHVYASKHPTFDAPIEAYLPSSLMQVAHEEGLSITLHIVRARALADSSNQQTLRRYADQYPNARIILAHAARGFNPHHTIAGVHALRGLANIWFDTSAVTDSGAIEAIVRSLGHERVLYGSDFPVSQMRGRCVAVGDGFIWLNKDNTQLSAPYGKLDFALIGHESLRMLKVAAMSLGLSDVQVEDIFRNNACRLYALG